MYRNGCICYFSMEDTINPLNRGFVALSGNCYKTVTGYFGIFRILCLQSPYFPICFFSSNVKASPHIGHI